MVSANRPTLVALSARERLPLDALAPLAAQIVLLLAVLTIVQRRCFTPTVDYVVATPLAHRSSLR
jgi:hypothetical protein